VAYLGAYPLDLDERVDCETAGALEPALVAGARERGQERVSVPGGTVAESGALLIADG
jgi:hypothetical protein